MCFELLPDGGSERDRMGSTRRWNKMDSHWWNIFYGIFFFFLIIIILNFYPNDINKSSYCTSLPPFHKFLFSLRICKCNHACPTKKSCFQFTISFFVWKVTYSVALQRKQVAINSWIPLSGREHKILESVTMNNEKHRIHKQNSRNKSSQKLSKTLKHFYRRRREL